MKQLRPTENKPILLLECILHPNSVTLKFRNEQTVQEIREKKPSDDLFYIFTDSEASEIKASDLQSVRFRWIVIRSFVPFVWASHVTSMDEYIWI